MRIALAQIASSADPTHNLGLVHSWAGRAADQGARLVLFPEATMASFSTSPLRHAEPLSGSWADGVREIASRLGIVVVAGMFTPGSSGRVRNTLLVTGEGVEASYDKIHLYDAFDSRESETIEPGSRLVTFDFDGLTFGLATCYDIRFSAQFTDLAKAGAMAILVPASWQGGPGKVDQWQILCRARALDSTSYVVGCGQANPEAAGTGTATGPTGIGHSMVVAPEGRVVGELADGPDLLVADLDLDLVCRTRATLPVLTAPAGSHDPKPT